MRPHLTDVEMRQPATSVASTAQSRVCSQPERELGLGTLESLVLKGEHSLSHRAAFKDRATDERRTSGAHEALSSPSASSALPSLPRALEGAEVIIWDGAE